MQDRIDAKTSDRRDHACVLSHCPLCALCVRCGKSSCRKSMSRQDLHQRQVRSAGGRQDQRLRSRPALRRRRVRRPAQLRRQGLPARRARRRGCASRPRRSGSRFRCRRTRCATRSTRRFASTTSTTATSALVVTRGAGTLGLDPNRCSNPQVIIIADAISLYPQELYEKGLEIVTVSVHAQSSGGAQPADQVAQLPQQHPGQDRRPAGRLHRSPDAQPQGRSGRVHGRQHLPRARRRAATRRRSTPASWKASRATR